METVGHGISVTVKQSVMLHTLSVSHGYCVIDRDIMAQDAQINWNQLDSFILGRFLKKKCLVF